jgi:hypothetical protein
MLLLSERIIKSGNIVYFRLVDPIIDELNSFAKLEKGWDCGYGSPISDSVINKAISIYNELKDDVFDYECSPGSNNSIEISFCLKDYFINVKISDKVLRVTFEKGIGSDFETLLDTDDISIKEIKTLLQNLKVTCFSLEPSTSFGINQKRKDSKNVSMSLEMESPFLIFNVPNKSPNQYVTI